MAGLRSGVRFILPVVPGLRHLRTHDVLSAVARPHAPAAQPAPLGLGKGGELGPFEADRARHPRPQSHDGAHQGTFAGTVTANNTYCISLTDIKRQIF